MTRLWFSRGHGLRDQDEQGKGAAEDDGSATALARTSALLGSGSLDEENEEPPIIECSDAIPTFGGGVGHHVDGMAKKGDLLEAADLQVVEIDRGGEVDDGDCQAPINGQGQGKDNAICVG